MIKVLKLGTSHSSLFCCPIFPLLDVKEKKINMAPPPPLFFYFLFS